MRTQEELIAHYNRKRNVAMDTYDEARRNYHATDDPELKKDYEAEKDYHSTRKAIFEEIISDLHDLRCGW